jgi:hypothetical protein
MVPEGGSRPVLGLASRRFEAALRGAGATKETNRWERSAEKEKGKEREPAKDGASSLKTRSVDGCMRKKDDPRARGGRAAAPQLGVLSTLTIL